MSGLDTHIFAGGGIEISFLTQVGPDPFTPTPERLAQIEAVATRIADFIGGAKSTLDIAIYDLRLKDAPAKIIGDALRAAKARGVIIRIAYDAATAGGSGQAPNHQPNPEDGAVDGPMPSFISEFASIAEIRAIKGYRVLMHNKYIIRDALSSEAALFIGSANFTNDSWGLQENNILFFKSQPLSTFYATDFAELWNAQKITDSTGYNDTGTVDVGDVALAVAFTPGESDAIVKEMVGIIQSAKVSLQVASVVISSGPILAALSEALDRGMALSGLYDGPQMDTVIHQWTQAGVGLDRIASWKKVSAHLNRKNSIPYDASKPGNPHNFMHNKLIVADNNVITGSFNLSRHAMGNAENVILLRDQAIADTYRAYLARIMAMYPKTA